jgi:DNA-binding NarL/FixJ family response regulator
MKRVLILADHMFVVRAIRNALRQTAGFEVVGFVDGRQCAAEHLTSLTPDVVLVDDMQSSGQALVRLAEVAEGAPNAKCLLLASEMADQEWLAAAFEAGADAVVSKTVHAVAFATLLREIVLGNVVHRPSAKAPAPIAAEDCPLTARELEILRLAACGNTNGQIARELWVTQQTVKFHLSNTYRKLGVANRTEASRYAHLNALVGDDEKLAA